jgi:hypothetical protein
MISYQVIVKDQQSKKQILSIPCADQETAKLVKNNLASLFTQSEICLNKITNYIQFPLQSIQHNATVKSGVELEDELENDLFCEVA